MAYGSSSWKDDQLRKYNITTEPIPRFHVNDSRVDEYFKDGKPMVITNTNLVSSAGQWDLQYLEDNIGNDDFTIYSSDNHVFKYFDEKKCTTLKGFKPPMKRDSMKFSHFVDCMKSRKPNDRRLYLQQALNDSVGPRIKEDFIRFNWPWITSIQQKNSWGPLTSNLLLIGVEGNVTPLHYDEQENIFAQVHGYKRVILYSPVYFNSMYPYPVYHAHDRQSQVDIEDIDEQRFPKFKEARGFETVLEPGDVLYLPMYWFHHFESLMNGGITTSITFWYKASPVKDITYPLKPQEKVAMIRNVEKMLYEALQDPDELHPLLQAMVLGRYTQGPEDLIS